MKIMSFNVNGIKSFTKFIKLKYNLSLNDYILTHLRVDILCLQETKCCKKDMEEFNTLKDFITINNINKNKSGIYGVSTIISKRLYCRKHNIKVPYSDDGRALLTDHKEFKILNLYCPFYDPSGNKTKESVIKFYREIYNFIKMFDDLIVLGDLNAVYSVLDHYVYYTEYIKLYDRKISGVSHDIKILELFPDIFNNQQFEKNFNKMIKSDDILEKKSNSSLSKLQILFGSNVVRFFQSYNFKYIQFVYLSLRHLPNLCINIPDDFDNTDIDFSIELLEKSHHTQIELPYLVENVSSLLLLFYSTYQRKWLLKFVMGMTHIDTFRLFHNTYESYTCWNTQLNLRPVNLGTRIDYIFVPIKFLNMIIYSDILDQVFGSDHCPVYVKLNIEVSDDKDNLCKKRNNLLGFFKK